MDMKEPKPEGPSIEDILIKEYQLKVVKPSQSFELPENLNFNSLEDVGVGEEDARNLVQSITDFENLPIIIDQFNQDHTARREWRKQIENRYGDDALSFLKRNKLRVNSFSFINYLFARVDLGARKTKPSQLLDKLNRIRQNYGEIVRGYAEMDIDEKVETVRKLDELFSEVIGLLRTQNN